LAKMLKKHTKTVAFFNPWAFFNALSHTQELHMQHTKPLQSRPEFAMCIYYVQFQYSSLHCFDSSVDLRILVKIKGVPWHFF
jgi:hypothetical protein